MTHSIIEDLRWRHTAKKYDPTKKVSQQDLKILLEAIRLSPSSINSQPWKFIVIESQDAKQRMYDTFVEQHSYNQSHIFDSSHTILFAHHPKYTRADYSQIVEQGIEDKRTDKNDRESAFAPFAFAKANTNSDGDTSCWTKAQTYLALGNTLHTLARLRIDSTPLEGIDIKRVNTEFVNELDGYQCDVALAIGYHHSEEDYNAKLPKSRLALDKILVTI